MTMNYLPMRQKYDLRVKVLMTQNRIQSFYNHFQGQVYISFSGGKDSTVLLHIARNIYPNIEAVFCDTGLELPGIRDFVNTYDNVTILKPKMPFNQVIQHYGYPVISKEQSQYIHQVRVAKSQKTINTRLYGNKWGRGKISEKWKFLLDAPFRISHKCCDVLKKDPAKKYEKASGNKPILGVMAQESSLRATNKNGNQCNSFEVKRPNSRPLLFWTEEDIQHYIKFHNIPLADPYSKGYKRTGCAFCLFGIMYDRGRFKRLEELYPKIYNYCWNKLDIKTVYNYIFDHLSI